MKIISNIIFSAFLLTISFNAYSQPKLVQKSVGKKGSMSIPFEKYKLDNGLTVIIHEDKSDPIVHVDVTYHVGSSREEPGKSGFAHFFEHMMFQGSKNVADDEHFQIINEAGGTLNGSTNFDRTNYFQTLPSNQLEVALWLEADRMGFLLDSVTSPKFEIQRATVKNERGQRYDNRPYGRNRERINEAMYPHGHPYSWPTIGWMEDIDRADLNDLKRFFLNYYGPNNAVLTITGNVETAKVLVLVQKYFGPISAGPKVVKPEVPAVNLESDRYISYLDNVRSPMLQVTYPTVPIYHEDEIALDALAEIMGGSAKNSFLFKSFIKPQKALRISASHPTGELEGQFSFTITAMPNTQLSEMDKLLQQNLESFASVQITQEQVDRFVKGHEFQINNSISSVSGKASMLAYYETFTGDADFIAKDQLRYKELTPDKVMEVFVKYILKGHAVKLSVVPYSSPTLIASADDFKSKAAKDENAHDKGAISAVIAEDIIRDGLIMEAPVAASTDMSKDMSAHSRINAKDNFDRSKKPNPGPAPVLKAPVVWKGKLGEKIPVYGVKNSENPIISAQIRFKGGHRLSSLDLSKAGISEFTARMLQEGSTTQSAEVIAEKLGMLGSSINVTSDEDEIRYSFQCLSSELSATAAILEDMLFNPSMDEEAFNRIKKQMIESIESQQTQAAIMADNFFFSSIYKQSNIQAIPQIGTVQSISSITLADISKFQKSWFSSLNCSMIISGDFNSDEVTKSLSFLGKIPSVKTAVLTQKTPPSVEKTEIIFINKDKAPQSEIRIGYPAIEYDALGEFYKAGIMNYALGGSFSSRVNLNLREDKGYTYGARTRFSGDAWKGVFLASAGVKANTTDSAVFEFMKEIRNYAINGISQKELTFTTNSWGQSEALKYETPSQSLALARRMADYNLDSDYMVKQAEIRKQLSVSEINRLAGKYLPYDKMLIVIVGDRDTVLPSLKRLGYPITQLNADGTMMNKGN